LAARMPRSKRCRGWPRRQRRTPNLFTPGRRARNKLGAKVVAIGEADYPRWLQMIDDPPPLIAIRGHATVFAMPQVAIVGSRNASAGGIKLTQRIAHGLCEAGFAIVSGLARGIAQPRTARAFPPAPSPSSPAVMIASIRRTMPNYSTPFCCAAPRSPKCRSAGSRGRAIFRAAIV
jgi:hypothetical protein